MTFDLKMLLILKCHVAVFTNVHLENIPSYSFIFVTHNGGSVSHGIFIDNLPFHMTVLTGTSGAAASTTISKLTTDANRTRNTLKATSEFSQCKK